MQFDKHKYLHFNKLYNELWEKPLLFSWGKVLCGIFSEWHLNLINYCNDESIIILQSQELLTRKLYNDSRFPWLSSFIHDFFCSLIQFPIQIHFILNFLLYPANLLFGVDPICGIIKYNIEDIFKRILNHEGMKKRINTVEYDLNEGLKLQYKRILSEICRVNIMIAPFYI